MPLPPIYWAWIAGFLVAYCVLTHVVKIVVQPPIRSRLMKSLLDALQEGRLIELPETDKDKALEFLAR